MDREQIRKMMEGQIKKGRKRRLEKWVAEDPTCLSYWFPKIQAAGLPTPRTIILPMSPEAHSDIFRLFDGMAMKGVAKPFFNQLKVAADFIGYPCFLRTGQTSGKHSWNKTCYVRTLDQLEQHVINLVEFSSIADFVGLLCNVWVVREYLPVQPYGVCPKYGDMPICKEFRFFVDDDVVRCYHPYWPRDALEQGGATLTDEDYRSLCDPGDDFYLHRLAESVGRAVGGSWSVDILETERGWVVTDLAEAHKSFHWETCNRK